MEMFSAVLILVTAITGSSCLPSPCQDIDSAACIAMATQDPNLCSDPGLSSLACPKYCKLCPLVCFNCTLLDAENQLCSQTKECSQGEQCMVRRLHSTADGHSEVVMQCASVQVCDLTSSVALIGKRDVSIHCCRDDLCNFNSIPTTTAAPTTPTTKTTTTTHRTPRPTTQRVTHSPTTASPITTLPPGCSADITIMIEDTASRRTLHTAALIEFIKDTVDKLQIGRSYNKVGLTLFDSSVNVQWKFNSIQSYYKAYLLHALDGLVFKYSTDDIDYSDIEDYLENLSNHTFAKDRATADDIVIIFSENDTQRLRLRHYHPGVDKIIYVSIGVSPFAGSFHNIAQYPQHVFSVPSYNDLQSIQTKLLVALCDPYDLNR